MPKYRLSISRNLFDSVEKDAEYFSNVLNKWVSWTKIKLDRTNKCYIEERLTEQEAIVIKLKYQEIQLSKDNNIVDE